MASPKQREANRANARKSTGPTSQAGKARSRLNSRKHGLTATKLVIVGENPDDFDELRVELLEQHDPRSALEFELVERLSGLLWRLRRVPFFEAAIIDARHAEVSEDKLFEPRASEDEEMTDGESSVHFGRALIKDGIWNDALGKLARHEATLMNAFTKTLQMLILLEGNRSDRGGDLVGEAVALPPKDR